MLGRHSSERYARTQQSARLPFVHSRRCQPSRSAALELAHMLHVRTTIKPSPIHGIGLFADQHIKKGTIVWQFEPGLDLVVCEPRFRNLPAFIQTYLKRYAYLNRNNCYVLCFDDAKHFNHAAKPNVVGVPSLSADEDIDIAARDIAPGEELTTNYSEFDGSIDAKLSEPFPDNFRRGSADVRRDNRIDHIGTPQCAKKGRIGDMGVSFGGGDACMSQEPLDEPDIHA